MGLVIKVNICLCWMVILHLADKHWLKGEKNVYFCKWLQHYVVERAGIRLPGFWFLFCNNYIKLVKSWRYFGLSFLMLKLSGGYSCL